MIGLLLFLLLLACDVLQPMPTLNGIETRVAEERTRSAIETAVHATLIAEVPKVTPTPVPPTVIFTPVPSTHTPTRIPVTRTPLLVPNFATVKGILVDGNTNKPLANEIITLGFTNEDDTLAIYIREGELYPKTHTDSEGVFVLQFDGEWPTQIDKSGPYFLAVGLRFPVGLPVQWNLWRGMDGNLVTLEVQIGQIVDVGVIKVRPP